MKKLIGVLAIFSFLLGGVASAQSSIDASLQDIYQTQNITSISQLDCKKVTDVQLEQLGDAYMGLGISEQQHAAMELMMGGEGSATLKQAHINMGRAYLGCWANYGGAPAMMSMMGSSRFGNTAPYWYGHGTMMGWASPWFGGVSTVLVWILLVLAIACLAQWLRKQK